MHQEFEANHVRGDGCSAGVCLDGMGFGAGQVEGYQVWSCEPEENRVVSSMVGVGKQRDGAARCREIGVGGGMHTFPDGSLQERQCWAHGYRRVMACVFGGAVMCCGFSLGTLLRRFLTKDLGWTCELDSDSDWMMVGDHADSV